MQEKQLKCGRDSDSVTLGWSKPI